MVDLASSLGEFVGHAVLIGTFQKPRAERLMDLQAGADDSLGEFRGRDRTLVLEVGHASIGKAETDCVSESRRMLSALYLFPVLSV